MFDKLIVSSKDRRRGKTGKVFFVTSLFYSLAIASALVISVVAATPLLADTSEMARFIPLIPPRMELPAGPPVVRSHRPAAAPPSQDLNHVARLEDLVRDASTKPVPVAPVGPPRIGGQVDPGGIPGGGDPNGLGGPGGSGIGVPGGDGRDIGTPPPPQPKPEPKPEPKPQVQQQPVRLASIVLSGKAIERKTPVYPIIAKQIRLQGAVAVEVMISVDGRVESARALSGHPILVKAALDAAYGWRFQPTLLNGIPVRVTGVITFNFSLQ